MIVQELREALLGLPGDMEVILSSDAEGNFYEAARVIEVSPATSFEGYEWNVHHPTDIAEGGEYWNDISSDYDLEDPEDKAAFVQEWETFLSEMREVVVIWP